MLREGMTDRAGPMVAARKGRMRQEGTQDDSHKDLLPVVRLLPLSPPPLVFRTFQYRAATTRLSKHSNYEPNEDIP